MAVDSKDIVLITGANSGIGYETTKLMASGLNCHILIGSRSIEKAEQAIDSINQSIDSPKGTLSPIVIDVVDHASISAAAEKIEKQYGRLDVLINNAGITPPKENSLVDQFRACFETNLLGQVIMTETFTPLLSRSSNPKLIFLSSSLGSITLRSDPNNVSYNMPGAPYRTSKAALNMWAACAAWQLKDARVDGKGGVPVWLVDPGLVATNLTGDAESLKARGAGSPVVSAQTILSCVEGKRDADQGKLLYKDGVYPF